MSETIVDRIYKDNLALLDYLRQRQEISFASQFDSTFKKDLLLASASYFEEEVCRIVQAFVERKAGGDECIVSLVKQKVIKRQYHTYFEWEGKNANKFFGMFGESFQKILKQKVINDPTLDTAIKAFLELGNMRNCLVHQNYAIYPINKTAEEVYALYQKAAVFIQCLYENFNNF